MISEAPFFNYIEMFECLKKWLPSFCCLIRDRLITIERLVCVRIWVNSGSDPSVSNPSSPLLCTTVVDFMDVEGVEIFGPKALALNLFSATDRNLERVSLEFHWPSRLDKFGFTFPNWISSVSFFSVSLPERTTIAFLNHRYWLDVVKK